MNYTDLKTISGFLNPLTDQGPVVVKAQTMRKILSENTERLCNLFFQGRKEVCLTRNDVFKDRRGNIELFLLSVLFWGYPGNQRGRCTKAFNNWEDLVNMSYNLRRRKNLTNEEFRGYFRTMDNISGLGISTYSKIFYFLGITIDGHPCLILDDMVGKGVHLLEGEEFTDIKDTLNGQRYRYYKNFGHYLRFAHKFAKANACPVDSVEYVLWLSGKKNI